MKIKSFLIFFLAVSLALNYLWCPWTKKQQETLPAVKVDSTFKSDTTIAETIQELPDTLFSTPLAIIPSPEDSQQTAELSAVDTSADTSFYIDGVKLGLKPGAVLTAETDIDHPCHALVTIFADKDTAVWTLTDRKEKNKETTIENTTQIDKEIPTSTLPFSTSNKPSWRMFTGPSGGIDFEGNICVGWQAMWVRKDKLGIIFNVNTSSVTAGLMFSI